MLTGDEGATIPGLLGMPRLVVAVLLLVAVPFALGQRPGHEAPSHDWHWVGGGSRNSVGGDHDGMGPGSVIWLRDVVSVRSWPGGVDLDPFPERDPALDATSQR